MKVTIELFGGGKHISKAFNYEFLVIPRRGEVVTIREVRDSRVEPLWCEVVQVRHHVDLSNPNDLASTVVSVRPM